MTGLSAKTCTPCREGAPPMPDEEKTRLHAEVPAWELVDGHHLSRTLPQPDFASGLGLVDRIGELAEREGHHPDLRLSFSELRIDIWTHKIDGLTESDFVLAAKIDRLFGETD